MLGKNKSQPALFQVVDVEALVPSNHRLRKIDAVLDLSFVREAVAECYSPSRGRPSIDPELALRMMLLGRLYDLGDRELCDEIGMHVGMRWFCGLNLQDRVPDHSTLSKLKNERWNESGLFQRLFDEVVRQCSEAGLVSGRHVSVDGSEVRANASMKSLRPIDTAPALQVSCGSEEPAGAASPDPDGAKPRLQVEGKGDDPPDGSGGQAAKEPQPKGGWTGHGVKYGNQTHRSTSDPEARLYRKGKAKEAKLCYLMNDLIDTKSRVILSRKVSEAHSSAERRVCVEMLDEVLARKAALGLPKRPEVASLDAGYGTGECAADLLDRGVLPHMPLQASGKMEKIPTWKRRTRDLAQVRKRRAKVRVARARNRVRELQATRGYEVSRRLRTRSEHTFAEAKTRHGMGRARSRGRRRVQTEAELTAIVQNLKRLASYRGRKRPNAQAEVAKQGMEQRRMVSKRSCDLHNRYGRRRPAPRPWPLRRPA
jgi:transposase